MGKRGSSAEILSGVKVTDAAKLMVDPERLELPTLAFEAQCSIQLSYGSTLTDSMLTQNYAFAINPPTQQIYPCLEANKVWKQ